MELSESPSVGTSLRALRDDLAELLAEQAAAQERLQRELEKAQAENAEAAAEAAEATRLRGEISALREELRRRQGQERSSDSAKGELVLPTVPQEQLEKEPRVLQLCPSTLPWEGQPQQCHHLCCHRCREGQSPSSVSPIFNGSIDFADPNHEGTLGQDSTISLKPCIFFIVASTIIFLFSFLKQT